MKATAIDPTDQKLATELGQLRPDERIRHVVLFAFQDDEPADRIPAIEAVGLTALEHQVPGIVDVEWGTNESPEGLDQGFTHCLLVTFDDAAARDSYVPHPGHVDFGLSLKALLDRVLVVDHAARD